MSIHVALRHITQYSYDRLVSLGPHVVRLRPAPYCRTKILSYSLHVEPKEHFINWQQDPQSNYLARLVFPEKTRSLRVEIDLVAEMAVYNPFDFFIESSAEHFPFSYDPTLANELEPYQRCLPLTPKFVEYLAMVRRTFGKQNRSLPPTPSTLPHQSDQKIDTHAHGQLPERGQLSSESSKEIKPRTIDFLVNLNQRISEDIKYLIRMEPGVQTPEETLKTGSGSCRDSAWLLCQLLRRCGLATRFVSGYLIQLKPDEESLDGPSGASEDFTDLHAWCEVYLPGAGWIGFDATSGMLAGEGHIPLAGTPDPQSAAPISGGVEKCETKFHFEMSVSRIHESPRTTKPYTSQQWEAIDALGKKIDSDLIAGDVRLTMGGEPTFVSIDDPDGEEWNFTAVGPRKRILSGELIRRLRRKFGKGGLLHYGQGKWYPGEPLPRWALGCYWRRDGVSVWTDESLIADESRNYGHGAKEARVFLDQLIDLIDVDSRWALPAYEDIYYYLWKERRLPSNVDPLKSHLKNKEERARIARIFEEGLGNIAGYVLPMKPHAGEWKTGPWFLRDETLWLIPGDSPMGLRLPLDSLPWVKPTDFPWIAHPDPFIELTPLPPRTDRIGQHFVIGSKIPQEMGAGPGQRRQRLGEITSKEGSQSIRLPSQQESASWITRTALCVEPRHGRLHVFMPPTETTEEYLDLIAAVEDAARIQGLPVIIEGEAPPRDRRLNAIKVTPDPGVIEVNMHPAHSWDELTENTKVLYEEARQTRLGTEKFMLDGRHTGTGGGNHIVIGGTSPADSPLLRRPDLLRSLLAYWHNHPSLSYLFTGLFMGPTSQAPRVDEARNDSLYELELAFKQIPDHGETPPWLVDRIFRNLLTDVTGNTHRAEFSIDKLFSPDSSAGRLGLLELRSFEMPPHAEMSLAQHLLLRGAIARFWKAPYAPQKLARWGTDLHDRFLLPHFVAQDFEDVLGEFSDHGYPLDLRWFDPHFEFKFPTIGSIVQRGVQLEIRTALEPWHVLGEEPGGGGNVRYVDSSVERLQVKVNGLVDSRHVVTCNGRRIPLHPTGVVGEYVAGVRYRAWQPPTCLHPTIGVDAPLVFDLLDTWNDRSIGGCTYHVAHPGGLSYETFPINAYEAESRRMNRFISHGHSQGKLIAPALESNREFPCTLDLRT